MGSKREIEGGGGVGAMRNSGYHIAIARLAEETPTWSNLSTYTSYTHTINDQITTLSTSTSTKRRFAFLTVQ